jgi:hypothetical protein
MAGIMQEEIREPNLLTGPSAASLLALSGALLAVIVCSKPIVVPLVVELAFASIFLHKPALAIKLMLFSAGLPLVLFYEDVGYAGGVAKPLFSEWGGTTPDGLRLILSCVLLVILLVRLNRTRALVFRFWPYALMLLFMLFSVFRSPARIDGLRLLMKIVFPFLVFLAAAQLTKSSQEADEYMSYWLGGGLVASLCAPVLVLVTGSRFLYPDGFRFNPGFTSASSFSFYMLALFLFCYARWRSQRSLGFALLAAVFGIQTVLPLTRIAWIGLLFGVGAFELCYVKGRKKWLVAGLIVLVPIMTMYTLVWSIPTLQERVFQTDRIESDLPALEQAQSIGLTGRGTVWLAGWEDYWQHSVLLGQGIGSSDHYFMTLFGTVAHNEYLRVLYDGGAIGLVLFLFANLWLLYWLGKSKSIDNSKTRVYPATGVALIVAYLLIAITDNPLDYYLLFTQYVFFVLGVCVALSGGASIK